MLERIELDNGLDIYYQKMDTEEVGIGLQVRIGSAFEPEELQGISHFLEHMFFSSNEKYSKEEMSRTFEFSGGSFNAVTSKERTLVYGSVIKDSFERVVRALYQAFINKTFEEGEFEREREVIKSEISRFNDNPDKRIGELMGRSLFSGSPYGRFICGKEKTVDNIGIEEMAEFKRKYYVPNNCSVILLGPVDSEILEVIEKYFGSLEPRKNDIERPGFGELENKIEMRKDIEESYYGLGWRTDTGSFEKFVNNEMLSLALSSGLTSILHTEFRNKRGIGYLAGSYFTSFSKSGYNVIVVNGFNPSREEEVRETAHEILEKVKDLPEDFIEGRKAYSTYQYTKNKKRMSWSIWKISKVLAAGFNRDLEEIIENLTDLKKERFRKAIENIETVEAVIRPEK